MNRATITALVLPLCFSLTNEAEAEGDDAQGFNCYRAVELLAEGISVAASGKYEIWAWAEGGKTIRLSIGGKNLGANQQSGAGFSWVKLGAVELEAGTPVAVKINDESARIGYVALGRGKIDPVRYFEAAKLFPHRPGPIDDYRLSGRSVKAARDYAWGRKYTLQVKGSRRDKELSALFHTESTREGWLRYSKDLKEHVLFCLGLLPMPRKTPLNARVFDTITHEDYTVSKVYLESYPGFFVCGNLYRPIGAKGHAVGRRGRRPAVLRGIGHWGGGRFIHEARCSVPAQMINFARQGYVAFTWDNIGVNDMDQIPHSGIAPSDNAGAAKKPMCFTDIPWGLSMAQLQTWNSIRIVDWISTLPDVNPERIGMTGASGGGTQTLFLAAVDDRIAASAPVSWGGVCCEDGCGCGVAPGLKVDTYNPEIMALVAPRPQIMACAADGWFPSMPHVEYPYLRHIYKLLGAENKVAVDSSARGGHNYNAMSRNIVNRFFGEHLLGAEEPDKLVDKPCTPDAKEKLLVFTEKNPRPKGVVDSRQIRDCLITEYRRLLDKLRPHDSRTLKKFREVVGSAFYHSVYARQPKPEDVKLTKVGPTVKGSGYTITKGTMCREHYRYFRASSPSHREKIPYILFSPAGTKDKGTVDIIIHPRGKAGLVQLSGEPVELVKKLLADGHDVLAIDCFLVGEYQSPFQRTLAPDIPRGDKYESGTRPDYRTCYNRTEQAWRVQDILTAIGTCTGGKYSKINLIGLRRAGLWCLMARPLAEGIGRTVIDADSFDPEDDTNWAGAMRVPGIRRAGGFRAACALVAPDRLLIHNTGSKFKTDWARDAYRVEKASEDLTIRREQLRGRGIAAYLTQ